MIVMSAGVSFLGATIFRLMLLFLVLLVILHREKPVNLYNYKYNLLFYIIWAIAVFFYFDIDLISSGQLLTYSSFFALIIASYYATVALDDFFKTYVKVIYHLSVISFFFYAIQLTHLDLLVSILRSFDGLNLLFKQEVSRPSIIIFTYATEGGVSLRNYGFATEPGEFSVFLILALMLHVTLNNFKIDKIIKVLILALLTTFSTSGYLGLVIFIAYVLLNKRFVYNKFWFAILALPAILLILNQNFVIDKITERSARDVVLYERAYEERITPGRIGSLLLDVQDFNMNPLVGYGVHNSTRYANYGGIEQQRSNGISDYLVRFGIVGFLIMVYNFYCTFHSLSSLSVARKKRNIYLIILAIFTVTFSQVILTSPIFLAIQFYHFQVKSNVIHLWRKRVLALAS